MKLWNGAKEPASINGVHSLKMPNRLRSYKVFSPDKGKLISEHNFELWIFILTHSKFVPNDKPHSTIVNQELRTLRATSEPNSKCNQNVTAKALTVATSTIRTGKAAGLDAVYPEYLKPFGPKSRTIRWLVIYFSNILSSGVLPRAFTDTHIIAVLKHGHGKKLIGE